MASGSMAGPIRQRTDVGGRLRELWRYRDLIYNLIVRDLKVRYKHSVLGILWSLLNPLLLMLVFTFVFTVMAPNNAIPAFYVFVLVGLIPWNFFSGAILGAAPQIIDNGHLIKKVYFPREALPLSAALSHFVNFLLSMIPLIALLWVSGVGFTRYMLWLPVIVLIQLVLMVGLGLLLSTITVFYRDMLMVLDVGMLALFFMTPIFYPMEFVQSQATVMGIALPINRLVRWLNPMASIVDSYRTVLYGVVSYDAAGQAHYFAPAPPALDFLLRTGLTALVIFLVGWWLFRRYSPRFGEEV